MCRTHYGSRRYLHYPQMNTDQIFQKLEKNDFKVSTDTRADLSGTVFFALRGDNFNGNDFVHTALAKGAVAAVSDDPKNSGENIFVVDSVLKTLQEMAQKYRQTFTIPIIAIGGSNGKTTSKDLTRDVLKTKYKTHATNSSLNNHIGVPLTLLSMPRDTEIAVFEIGANHPGEHLELLNIIQPTHVVVTNNGMDHLEGFGSPEGSRLANKEIYDWATEHSAVAFVNKNHADLLEDSDKLERIMYPENPRLSYKTHLVGNYNYENIELALAIGAYFKVEEKEALRAIAEYQPLSKRSQSLTKNNIHYIVDCYNANPTSMTLALESFVASAPHPRGVVLGDMLELGSYTDVEHTKIVDFVLAQDLETAVFVGKYFGKALKNKVGNYQFFRAINEAKEWFAQQKFEGYTFLLKGSRGVQVEKILE